MTRSVVPVASGGRYSRRARGLNLCAMTSGVMAALTLGTAAQGATLTPPNLVQATSIANADYLLTWPTASSGPLEAITWSNFKTQLVTDLGGTSFLKVSNNLSDLANQTIARTNLGLGSASLINTGTSAGTLCLLNTACTWSLAQTFTTAPVFTDQAGSRTALGLGTAATQNTGTSGAVLCLLNAASCTFSGEVLTPASATGGAGLNIAPGVAPTSPNNGDVWTTSSGLFARIAGSTLGMGSVTVQTFTPTVTFATPGDVSVTYSTDNGIGYRVVSPGGAMCWASYKIVTNTFTFTTASGSLLVSGLPWNTSSLYTGTGVLAAWGGFTGATGIPVVNASSGNGTFSFNYGTTGSNNVDNTKVTSGTNLTIAGEVQYVC